MKSKRIFKRLNRGLILGLVLLIGLVIYVNIDNANFKKEMPVIQETLNQYLEDCADIAIWSPQYQKLNKIVPADIVDQTKAKGDAVFNKYWVSSQGENEYGTKSELVKRYQELLQRNAEGIGYITKWSATLNGMPNIIKSGPRDATVTINYTQVVEFVGAPVINSMMGTIFPEEYTFSKEDNADDSDFAKAKRLTSNSYNLNLEMTEVDGVWKIVKAGSMWVDSGTPEIIE